MPQCAHCGTSILFGGVKDGGNRYCNSDCHAHRKTLAVVDEMPDDFVYDQIEQARQGPCPKCNGAGPIDVHSYHYAVSVLVVTTWNSTPEVCCRSCATWGKLKGCVISFFFGWWGFPFGLIATPIQILRNVGGFFTSPPPGEFENLVRMNLAAQFADYQKGREGELEEGRLPD